MKVGYHVRRQEDIPYLKSAHASTPIPGTINNSCFFDRSLNNLKSSYISQSKQLLPPHQYPL